MMITLIIILYIGVCLSNHFHPSFDYDRKNNQILMWYNKYGKYNKKERLYKIILKWKNTQKH